MAKSILELITYYPEFEGEWAAFGWGGLIDHDKDLSALDKRMKEWEKSLEVEGETIPLNIKNRYVLTINTQHSGCGGCHYEYYDPTALKW